MKGKNIEFIVNILKLVHMFRNCSCKLVCSETGDYGNTNLREKMIPMNIMCSLL